MASFQEEPLAAGLLTVLVTSFAATPTAAASASSSFRDFPASTSGSDSNTGGHNGGHIHEWSSLIGIVTALVGNVLISLALNIQRYAHIRIEREWEQSKLQRELQWKRANSGRNTAGAYGATVDEEDDREPRRERGPFPRYRDESPDSGPELPEDFLRRSDEFSNGESGSRSRLRESFLSDQTIRPGDKDSRHGRRKSYLRSPYWWAGIVLMCLGETGNFMAYGFAPASIVSPLGVVALISNCVIAPIMLKEKFRQRDAWGVLIAIAGAVVVVLSASSSEEKIGPHDIWVMITRWEFELYLGLTACLIVALMWVSHMYGSRTILIDVGLVALFGGYTALSTKGVSSLLSFTLWHVITFPITYLLVFVLVFSALMQIRYINRALQRFDSTQVIPTQFVLFTLSVIVGSAVLYRDFENYTAERASKFVSGCLMTFLGVYFITSGRVRADDESSFSIDDEEEAIGLLGGERYQDSVDIARPAHQARARNPGQRQPVSGENDLQSPSGSLLSHGIEDVDEDQLTPKDALSAAPSSPVGSLTAESLTQPSPGHPSSLHSHSLLTNPWADHLEQHVQASKSEPQLHRPATPPKPSENANSDSTVLLQFPPAPGIEDHGHQPSSPSKPDHVESAGRANIVPQTPPARNLRNSISKHFSPGPLLPTLSAGFSAVVAESLRRGETSPMKDRKTHKRSARRKQLSTTVFDGYMRNRDSDLGVRSDEVDAGVGNDHHLPFQLATARLHSTGDLPTAPGTVGNSTPVVDSGDQSINPSGNGITTLTRLRSFSDSWSGGLAWLGGALRKPNSGNKVLDNPTAVEAAENDNITETHDGEGGRQSGADTQA
ncbi:NIPA-like protein 3 [Aspergillus viridinutans]|uniref:NIPA-like protein 3 n=1 Tax=Aspergillus viridinutans TaxID=75553 RepID=A0A9P3BR03_ASPVI|nr:NIPA-like protein 3 [Aspergillus viridinutans]GIK00412.1 NIPA-like protein 3 [Aspergillus viridinutans]